MKRIKHLSKPKSETKYISINDKTLIEVNVNIPDNEARELYQHKLTLNKPTGRQMQESRHLIRY